MKKVLVILLAFIGFIAFGQINNITLINSNMNLIELDSTLILTEFD